MLASSAMDDPTIPCGDARRGGEWRRGCGLSCCVKKAKPESDEEWEAEAAPMPVAKRSKSSGSSYHRG
eukprot:4610170-Prymnesium_polylepis.1